MCDAVSVWREAAALSPKSSADEVSACPEIGEYETALSLLAAGLVDHDAHVGESLRTGILLLAEEWAVRGRVWDELRRCRIVPESEAPLTLVDQPDAAPSGDCLSHVPGSDAGAVARRRREPTAERTGGSCPTSRTTTCCPAAELRGCSPPTRCGRRCANRGTPIRDDAQSNRLVSERISSSSYTGRPRRPSMVVVRTTRRRAVTGRSRFSLISSSRSGATAP